MLRSTALLLKLHYYVTEHCSVKVWKHHEDTWMCKKKKELILWLLNEGLL